MQFYPRDRGTWGHSGMRGRLDWKIRRIAAGMSQQVFSREAGIAFDRYSAIERGDILPTENDVQIVEQVLPRLPATLVDQELGTIKEQLEKLQQQIVG